MPRINITYSDLRNAIRAAEDHYTHNGGNLEVQINGQNIDLNFNVYDNAACYGLLNQYVLNDPQGNVHNEITQWFLDRHRRDLTPTVLPIIQDQRYPYGRKCNLLYRQNGNHLGFNYHFAIDTSVVQ
jgi:hypothetical protein